MPIPLVERSPKEIAQIIKARVEVILIVYAVKNRCSQSSLS